MPALQPLSMQIGALPPGYSSISPLPAGPALAYGFNLRAPALVQQNAAASSAAAPATFTNTFAASTAGTTLVFLVAAALSGAPTISTPGGWTALPGASATSPGNTIATRAFIILPANNPGGLTTAVITTLAGVNGIATTVLEFSNTFNLDGAYATAGGVGQGTGTAVNSSTTPSTTAYTLQTGTGLMVGLETDLTGQAYTAANLGAGWVTGTTATSTVGATNCIIRPFWAFTNPELTNQYQITGTLAGALANSVSMVSLLTSTSGAMLQPVPQAYASQNAAAGAAWGPLGGTKPGGAGSGQ